MKKKSLLYCLCLGAHLSGFHPVQSQPFEKRYGGNGQDMYNAVTPTSDGGFVMAGNTSSFGNGGLDVFIVKTGSSGNMLWSRVIGGAGDDMAYAVAEEGNGNILIAGQTTSSGAGGADVYLIKLDPFGRLLWTKTIGGTGTDYAKGLVLLNDKYFIAGATSSSGAGGSDVYLLKTDTSGTVRFSKTYGYPGDDYANAITATAGGNLVLAGRTSNFGVTEPVYVLKVKTDGDTLWTRNFNENNSSQSAVKATSVTELKDHSYVVTGYGFPYNGGYGNMFHLKIDGSGNKIYSNWSGLLADYGNSVTRTSDGGYVVSTQYCNYGCRIRLIKYNSSGSQVWQHDYLPGYGLTYAEYSNGFAVQETPDRGFVVAGYTNWTSGGQDALILTTDSTGVTASYTTPVLTSGGPTTFCSPDSVVLSAPAGYTTYQWIWYSGNYMSYLDKTAAITVKTTGTYYCVLTDNQGIYISGTIPVTVYSSSIPVITASGETNFCAAAGQTLTLNAPAGYSYQWKLNGGTIPGATTNSHNPVSSGSYSVDCTNFCGTFSAAPVPVNASTAPASTVITCPSGFCDLSFCFTGYQPELEVTDFGPGTGYDWKLNGNSVQTGSSPNYYVSQGGTYTCIISNACGSDTAGGFLVNQLPPPVYNIFPSGPTGGCGPTNVILNAPYSSGSYEWYLYSVPIPGATSSQYTATAVGDYTVFFFDDYCGQFVTTNPLTVSMQGPAPFITAGGPTQVCAGPVSLTAGITGPGVSYNWYKDNVQLPGATGSSYAAAVSGNYACVIYNPACGSGLSNSLDVVIGQPAGSAGPASVLVCSGNTTSISFTPARSGYNYQWQLNGNTIPGASASSYSTGTAGNYTCMVSNTCGSIISNAVSVTVNALPPATATAQGSTALCPAGSVILSANTGGGYTYQWFRNNISQGGATLQNYTATTSGSYKVRVTNSSGCSSFSGPDIMVTSITTPVASAKALDYPRICSGSTVALKAGTAAGYNYQWKRNGVNLSGATDSVYQAGAAGLYSVTTSNACGTAVSGTVEVIQVASPSPVIVPSGSTSFCSGGQVTLTISATAGSGYQWKKNGTSIPGATSFSCSANASGNYKAVKINSYGCTGTSATTTVTVYNNPTVATTAQGPTTFCAGDSVQLKTTYSSGWTYQWKRNNLNISQATSNKYQAKTAGFYKTKVTNGHGCSSISSPVQVSVPCRESELSMAETDPHVSVYPNPSSADFVLKIENENNETISIKVFDATGKLMINETTNSSSFIISNSQLSTGIYAAVVVAGENKKVIRLIKINQN